MFLYKYSNIYVHIKSIYIPLLALNIPKNMHITHATKSTNIGKMYIFENLEKIGYWQLQLLPIYSWKINMIMGVKGGWKYGKIYDRQQG